mmetsp:Transcript_76562/g.211494  ORF Transcript_76562/g.211494 Transcript_76562/m.211494 type:complete len:319 (-) Transcript_76562:233-1189(-)
MPPLIFQALRRRKRLTSGPASQSGEAEASTSEECCAICFEHHPFVSLPCSCRVNYCTSCWDRALAMSITVRGSARCPTCRSDFRVDFNPKTGGLMFSPDTDGTASRDWRSRLYRKTQPAQIQMLRDYGASMAGGAKGRGGNTLLAVGAGACGEAKTAERRKARLPPCVCGGELERVSSRVRILRVLEAVDSGWKSSIGTSSQEAVIAQLSARKPVHCDLCQEDATRTGHVWTCKSGQQTVLHPAAFDVCEKCFALHVGLDVALTFARGQRGLERRSHSFGCAAGRVAPARGHDTTSATTSSLPVMARRITGPALASQP